MTRRADSDRIRARSETIPRMPAWRRATFLSYAPRAQRGELDAARMASDIAAYRGAKRPPPGRRTAQKALVIRWWEGDFRDSYLKDTPVDLSGHRGRRPVEQPGCDVLFLLGVPARKRG